MNIGVVIVNYNSGGYLRRCIDSLLRSDVSISVVIVDNDSSDNSISEIKGLVDNNKCLSLLRHQQNVGFSAGVNAGIAAIKSAQVDFESVLVLNPDCMVHPHTIGKLAGVLRSAPEVGIAGPLIFNQDGTEQRGCRRREPTFKRSMITALGLGKTFEGVDMTNQPLPATPVEVDAVSGAAMMIRRHCLDQIGGLDESYFLHCEDLDLCRRMREAGYKVMLDPGVSLFHQQGVSGGANFNQVERLKHQGMVKYYSRHYAGKSWLKTQLVCLLVWSHFLLGVLRNAILSKHRNKSEEPNKLLSLDLTTKFILLSGANSDVGESVVQSLSSQTLEEVVTVFREGRHSIVDGKVLGLAVSYFEKAPVDDQPQFYQWLNLAPIWSSQSFLPVIKNSNLERVVAISSTSVSVKADSKDRHELEVVKQLIKGEADVRQIATDNSASSAILRPTLIYGGPRNQSINVVRKIIRCCRLFPLIGKGSGLRQPVHVDDVAAACIALLGRPQATGLYTVAGEEVLSYRKMIGRVFQTLGYSERFISLPYWLVAFPLLLLSKVPGLQMFTPQIAFRMDRDQVFSNQDAISDFDYQPRKFQP